MTDETYNVLYILRGQEKSPPIKLKPNIELEFGSDISLKGEHLLIASEGISVGNQLLSTWRHP